MLTPDFLRKDGALEIVVAARPDVFNHNLETVPSLYLSVRPGARYFHSLRLLQRVKELDPTMFTKSGIMVGLGEERNEVLQVMDDLRSANVDFLTIGQYLQPTRKHHEVKRFVPPDEFEALKTVAYAKGFLMVAASPLTRSSHHAGEDFARLKAARAAYDPGGNGFEQRSRCRTKRCRNSPPSAASATRAADMFDLVADVREISGIRAAVRRAEGASSRTDKGEGVTVVDRRHDGRLQDHPRDLHQPRHARPAEFENPGRISRRPVQAACRTAGRSSRPAKTPARSNSSSSTNSEAARWRC